MVAKLIGAVMAVKDTDKIQNQKLAKSRIVLIILILILVKEFIPRQLSHDSRHCFINNTTKLRLLVSKAFW